MLHAGAGGSMISVQELLQLFPSVTQPQAQAFGWLVTLACAAGSLGVALRFLEQSPRMFTATALFACSWFLVLGVYKQPEVENKLANELASLMSEIGSFLNVYIGGLLVLEGEVDRKNYAKSVASLQRWALWLLLFIAVPKAIPFPDQVEKLIHIGGLSADEAKVLAAILMDLAGFASIAYGANWICDAKYHNRQYIYLLAAILVFYSGVVIAYGATMFHGYVPMSPLLTFLAALAKLSLTAVFCMIVVKHAKYA
jgi:hypothetical protein